MINKILYTIIVSGFLCSQVLAGNLIGSGVVDGGTSCISDTTAIGNDTLETGVDDLVQQSIQCWRFTSLCSGDINELSIYVGGLTAVEDATMGIYSDKTSGCTGSEPHCPDTKLKDTAAFVGTAANPETIVAALDSAQTLVESVEYWICVGDGEGDVFYPRFAATGGDYCESNPEFYTEGTMPATLPGCGDIVGAHDGAIWGIAQ